MKQQYINVFEYEWANWKIALRKILFELSKFYFVRGWKNRSSFKSLNIPIFCMFIHSECHSLDVYIYSFSQ